MKTFDFIKPNVIWKLNYKVKYISQINGGLILLLVGSIVNNIEKINRKKSNTINIAQC